MNKRIQSYNEKTATYSYMSESLDPPLKITMAFITRWGPGDRFHRRERSNLSVNLVTMGDAIYSQEGRQGHVRRGQIFLAHKGCTQTLAPGGEGFLHKRTLFLEGAALDSLVASLCMVGRDLITPRDFPATMRLFRQAFKYLTVKPPGLAKELSTLAWRVLLDCSETLSPDASMPLRRAMNYAAANLHRHIAVPDLARGAGLSVRHCTRLFQSQLGCSPMAFCIRQRMAMAKNMVLDTNYPFKQIAAALGYSDSLYFSAQFRKHFGTSPSAFRAEAKRR